ncbi:MAG: hypothetical protein EB116_20245, partial [Betaproteobacteria bacterium]|nr:hypothetical protein [Betaproteobacteria bacterium]
MSTSQLSTGLSPATLDSVAIRSLSSGAIAAWDNSQVAALTSVNIRGLSSAQVAVLNTGKISALEAA